MGKLADLVMLSADPFTVDSDKLASQVSVLGTWLGGAKVDTAAFVSAIEAVDPSEHKELPGAAMQHRC